MCTQINIKTPADCSKTELAEFEKLVTKADEVTPVGLSERIRRAQLVGFHLINGITISVAAIKTPTEHYKQSVFQKAGTPENANVYLSELGWAFTEERFRRQHLCDQLINALLSNFSKPLFATTRITNAGMQFILEKYDFKQVGRPYPGKIGDLFLYVRDY